MSNISQVYACGEGSKGRLGLGHSNNVSVPQLIKGLGQYVIRKVAIHSVGKHCLAINTAGIKLQWSSQNMAMTTAGVKNRHIL